MSKTSLCCASLVSFMDHLVEQTGADAFEMPISALSDACGDIYEEDTISDAMLEMERLGCIRIDHIENDEVYFLRFNREATRKKIEQHHREAMGWH